MIEFIQFIDSWFRNEQRASLTGSVILACVILAVWISVLFIVDDSLYKWFVLSVCGASVVFYVRVALRDLRDIFEKPSSDDGPSIP